MVFRVCFLEFLYTAPRATQPWVAILLRTNVRNPFSWFIRYQNVEVASLLRCPILYSFIRSSYEKYLTALNHIYESHPSEQNHLALMSNLDQSIFSEYFFEKVLKSLCYLLKNPSSRFRDHIMPPDLVNFSFQKMHRQTNSPSHEEDNISWIEVISHQRNEMHSFHSTWKTCNTGAAHMRSRNRKWLQGGQSLPSKF